MGEKFVANTLTGTASFSIPLGLTTGRGTISPALSLSYDSGAGNGPFGLGWDLAVSATPLADGRILAAGGTVRAGDANPGYGADLLTATSELFTP